jgi:hypothetical protein
MLKRTAERCEDVDRVSALGVAPHGAGIITGAFSLPVRQFY